MDQLEETEMAIVRTKARSCVLFLLSGLLLIVLWAEGVVLTINPVNSGLIHISDCKKKMC